SSLGSTLQLLQEPTTKGLQLLANVSVDRINRNVGNRFALGVEKKNEQLFVLLNDLLHQPICIGHNPHHLGILLVRHRFVLLQRLNPQAPVCRDDGGVRGNKMDQVKDWTRNSAT